MAGGLLFEGYSYSVTVSRSLSLQLPFPYRHIICWGMAPACILFACSLRDAAGLYDGGGDRKTGAAVGTFA